MSSPGIRQSIDRFAAWLESHGDGLSHDPYDLWGTRYGCLARRLYYQKNPLGKILAAPLLAVEIFCPGARAWFVARQRFATADAQLVLAFLNLYSVTGRPEFLGQAKKFAGHLLASSIPGYSGHCWGYPFDWENNLGLWKRNTPFITATPYGFEAFLALFDATGDESYLEVARSTAEFVSRDLHDTPTAQNAAAASYGPHDRTLVINAAAYRAWVLFEAARRFDRPAYAEKAERNLNFILQHQREDGAWMYAINNPAEQFIDHFHTCFVLKNLCKLNVHRRDPAVGAALERGYDFYRRELFDAAGVPKQFAIRPRTQVVRLEMYDVAEAITLGTLLRTTIPEAGVMARHLAGRLAGEWQVPAGHFITRVYRGGIRHRQPYLRWPQAPLFYALTNLFRAMEAEHGRNIRS